MKQLVMVLSLVVLAACMQEETGSEKAEERVTPVQVDTVQKDDFVIEREISGSATAGEQAPVTAKTPGELVTLNVEKGDRVEKGETIGVVDPGNGESQVELQELAVRQAEQQLENARLSKEQAAAGVENAEDQVTLAKQASQSEKSQTAQAAEAAEQQYEQAKQLADETQKLFKEEKIPEALYEQAANRAEQAQAQMKQLSGQAPASASAVAQAEAQVDQAEQQIEQADMAVEQAELQVEQANVQLEQAKEQAANEAVTAPVSGEVASLNASEGDLVTNQQPFATVVSLNPMTITASVTAEQLDLFNKEEELKVNIGALEDEVTATVTYVSSVPDDTGLYPVEARVDNGEETIKPGMMATFLLPEKVVEDTLIIPTDSLVEENEETFVYQIVDEKAVQVAVEVVERQTDQVAVTSEDLPSDADVITSGQLTLTDGDLVRVMKEDSPDEAR
ncbi:efflux RND transporter periplasmic adaptor subunit [Halobacillus sp. ACCC02827]|uniref:efflux RND transporter periplasmic adaptor subunit n=1 Tax=Halobacillus sp. ACCC02827 TaxID=3052090 RepID=UPI002570EAF7|nr:efflux RND transporter periplasmic adaptor subunit [Halobacillus sp. ACCC02827]WJE17721.1 efflux RND transporter periplasmic adaptor subunit [Halobacillus sp. ACCC02827]